VVDQTFNKTPITEAEIYATAQQQYISEIEQYPQTQSSIKIKSEHVYEKARSGEEVELKARRKLVNSFEIVKIEIPHVYFRITCSKGTYIRYIAHDFGKALGIGAHLSQLRRTKSGDFHVENAWNLQDLIERIKLHKTSFQQQPTTNNK